jgi:exopolyphosphatase/guanosine-5'-triphosphate,3'-diphosphate pyrophosphatase
VSAERRLVIDIGTNSVLALLADVQGDRLNVISDRKATTRLGEGLLSTGKLSSTAMLRTSDAVVQFAADIKCDKFILLGTEALRIATNAREFKTLLVEKTGSGLQIISGDKEAELAFLGAIYNLPIPGKDVLLIDVGGGSTELVFGRNGKIIKSQSVPIGALKLLESLPDDTADIFGYFTGRGLDYLMNPLSDFHISPHFAVISTGGTSTSAAAIATGMKTYDAAKIHGMHLSYAQMEQIARQFEKAGPEKRPILIPFDPERAELILPGLGIYLAFMSIIEQQTLVVSTGGLRFGAALHPDKINYQDQ